MVLIRPTALRASAIARFARPTKSIRTVERQPWQRTLQRRTYASSHGDHGTSKKSDLPWAATGAVGFAAGLYVILNQDLSHGEGHHGEPPHSNKNEDADEEAADEDESEADEGHGEEDKKDDTEDDQKDDESEDKKKEQSKGGKDKAAEDPAQSDSANPHKEPKSTNETSGKQAGLSNDDFKFKASNVSDDPQKSKKGEGAVETAKLKGTVDVNRPGPENKEERGNSTMNKDK
ncbi:hypothetical protein BDV95DRAFT_345140 [Massariosphaeria phaeospora]|uniref:Uncharacterized protein n=1 Tax=Massariosphaeria phaeospora TaxID=100035 RepID=A0A7C8IDF2_9PLEO|nr:hypothetical protein BDV95DRAFT_345140 [Massariosphaeria phaeospora]